MNNAPEIPVYARFKVRYNMPSNIFLPICLYGQEWLCIIMEDEDAGERRKSGSVSTVWFGTRRPLHEHDSDTHEGTRFPFQHDHDGVLYSRQRTFSSLHERSIMSPGRIAALTGERSDCKLPASVLRYEKTRIRMISFQHDHDGVLYSRQRTFSSLHERSIMSPGRIA